MGDWAIVVEGTGAHHNKDYPTDADRMAQTFVDGLVAAGHTVRIATFTAGGRTVLDTTVNLRAKQGESAYYALPENAEKLDTAIDKRRDAFDYLGLGQAPRREPFPGT